MSSQSNSYLKEPIRRKSTCDVCTAATAPTQEDKPQQSCAKESQHLNLQNTLGKTEVTIKTGWKAVCKCCSYEMRSRHSSLFCITITKVVRKTERKAAHTFHSIHAFCCCVVEIHHCIPVFYCVKFSTDLNEDLNWFWSELKIETYSNVSLSSL